LQYAAVTDRDQLGVAGRGDVEAFVDAAAAARGVVRPDRSARPVRTLDGKDVPVVRDAAVAARDLGLGGRSQCGRD
jgi:hypothetical protein